MTMTHRHHRIGGRRVAGAALAVGLLAAGCSSADDADQSTTPTTTITTPTTTITTTIAGDAGTSVSVDDDGVTTVDGDALDDELAEIPADDLSGDLSGDLSDALSDADRANLIFMREEEKLALDVYDALYDIWGLRIFDNIARAHAHVNVPRVAR